MKRLYLIIVCLALAHGILAQSKPSKRKKPASFNKQSTEAEAFLDKQWWLGFKAGVNLSEVVVTKSYSIVSPTNYSLDNIRKKYKAYDMLGAQAGVEITFFYKGFSISLQPTYKNIKFGYTNHYEWTDPENANNYLELNYAQEQSVDYVDFPLLVKYNVLNRKLKPYVQIGGYVTTLVNATKTLTVSGLDRASGGDNTFKNEPISVGAKDLFASSHWGLLGGIGLNYNLGNVRLNLDVQYKYGMSNIASTQRRNNNNQLSGTGDMLDDMTLNNLSFNLGALFPLRFLSSGFKSINK
jgi:outer membrane protein W